MRREGVTLHIRTLTPADFTAADAILAAAYNRTYSSVASLGRYLALEPEGWLWATLDGVQAGLVGAISYGSRAWVGLMAVDPPLQRRGIARALLAALLDWLEARRCPLVLLDASDSGAPLYRQFGFEEVDQAHLYLREQEAGSGGPIPPSVAPMRPTDLANVAAFDALLFAADRRRVLASYYADDSTRAFISRDGAGAVDGYLIAQNAQLGPWAATNAAAAEALLRTALTLPFTEPPRVIVPAANQHAAGLLSRYGFALQRRLAHMQRGVPVQVARRDLLYGQASFALG